MTIAYRMLTHDERQECIAQGGAPHDVFVLGVDEETDGFRLERVAGSPMVIDPDTPCPGSQQPSASN